MTDGITIFRGLHPHLQPDAARIYWDAFGSKLGRVLGPTPRALAFFQRVMRLDHCFTAIAADGSLVGLAGFRTAQGSFAGGGWSDLRAVYGLWGAEWRGAALWLLGGDTDADRFLIDGICVARDHRSRGVGTRLLEALYAEATARGHAAIRLDVIDGNWRARALYARHGFTPTRTERLGPLRHLFGFKASTTMVRPLPLGP
ncbi:MAG: N-acetyltransferase [Rhodobacterales bacterium 32-66-7]|nr:MAG: N-acetyltransferase [Rhodobacterales bacterium 12-65-15]OYX24469.1 MAG: N-acetyltransferase [Rhodobacterales bacterium 32-66-7]